jgi:hypothetical protein
MSAPAMMPLAPLEEMDAPEELLDLFFHDPSVPARCGLSFALQVPICRCGLRIPHFAARSAATPGTALGNVGTDEDLTALQAAALDPEPLIAEHAAWAIEEIRRRARVTCSLIE